MPAPPDTITTAMRQQVMGFANSQIGDKYRFGAVGPNEWDCSGLTMVAWNQVGVELPHNSAQQFAMSNRLMTPLVRGNGALTKLWRGDILFYYNPISHCALYDGWDSQLQKRMIVQAADPAHGVNRIGLWDWPSVPPVAVLLIGHN